MPSTGAELKASHWQHCICRRYNQHIKQCHDTKEIYITVRMVVLIWIHITRLLALTMSSPKTNFKTKDAQRSFTSQHERRWSLFVLWGKNFVCFYTVTKALIRCFWNVLTFIREKRESTWESLVSFWFQPRKKESN